MVGVVGLTFSVLVFYAEKDNKEKEWTFLDSFCWGLMTLTTGKSAFDLKACLDQNLLENWVSKQRFFDQVGHETMYASSRNKRFSLNLVIVRPTKIMNRANKNWALF